MGHKFVVMAEIDNDEVQWLVVDKGSSVIKAGFSGHDSPLSVFHSVVCGRQLTPSPAVMAVNNRHYAGDEARSSAGMFELEYPIKNGIVQNWDYMERIYKQIFVNDLRVESKDRPILLSDPCFNPKQDREKHTQMLFESFQSPAVALHNEGLLGWYASGRNSGIALCCGDGVLQIVPIIDGYSHYPSIRRYNFGGRDLTKYLARLLTRRGHYFYTSSDMDTVREIKERLCYVAEDYPAELEKAQQSSSLDGTFELPCGQELTISEERFQCAEALFNPSLIDVHMAGVHELLWDAISDCEIHHRTLLLSNIVLVGGCTMLPGFPERLKKELEKKVADRANVHVRVVSPPERRYSVWIGGSILSSLSSFKSLVSKDEYEEWGPSIIHKHGGFPENADLMC